MIVVVDVGWDTNGYIPDPGCGIGNNPEKTKDRPAMKQDDLSVSSGSGPDSLGPCGSATGNVG